MSRKIIGVTVGTNINPRRLEEYVQDGKSAYELAVENGFKGTEEEWLASLNGADGYTPVKGKDYFDGVNGKDGYTPIKGVDYFDGKDGNDGYTPVKGKDYFDGKDGKDGKDGCTPVKGIDYFDGKPGKDGQDGVDGYTPIKGVDYFTEDDKQEIAEQAAALVDVPEVPTKLSQLDNDMGYITADDISGGNANVPTEEEILQLLMDMNIVQPLSNTNNIVYTDENDKLYVL